MNRGAELVSNASSQAAAPFGRQPETFKNKFLNASPAERFQLIQATVTLNADPQITNLISNLDVNYRMNTKNLAAEAQVMRRVDNIHFVYQQLKAFPNFKSA